MVASRLKFAWPQASHDLRVGTSKFDWPLRALVRIWKELLPMLLPVAPTSRSRRTRFPPHMSAETLDYHHGKHHKAYVTKTSRTAAAGAGVG